MATAGDARGSGPERVFAPALPPHGRVTLSPEESRHVVRSRRVREGDPVVLFDGEGTTCAGVLRRADPRAAVVDVVGPYPDRSPARTVTLAVSPPESGRADEMVTMLAELGVERFVPTLCERTAVQRADAAERRRARWERLALEAAKRNGRSRRLRIDPPASLAEVVARFPGAVLLDPDPSLPALPRVLPEGAGEVALVVGPEGGFTPVERDLYRDEPGRWARLSSTALSSETAAVAAAAVALAT